MPKCLVWWRTAVSENGPVYYGLTLEELIECKKWNEEIIKICHPQSGFVPLCKRDLEKIEQLIKQKV